MAECSNGVPCRSRMRKLIKPDDRSGSAWMSSWDCSPLVDTRAAQITSESLAECLIISTVMSLRNSTSVNGAPSSGWGGGSVLGSAAAISGKYARRICQRRPSPGGTLLEGEMTADDVAPSVSRLQIVLVAAAELYARCRPRLS